MFVGHLGVGLGLKKAAPEVNLGLLVFAAFLLDVLLGLFVLLGLEQIHVPANYAQLHYLRFTFPSSHGLLASLLWAAVAFIISTALWPHNAVNRTRAGLVVGAAVWSHWTGDAIEHVPVPLMGANSPTVGLSLWNHLGIAIGLELLLTVGVSSAISRRSRTPAARPAMGC